MKIGIITFHWATNYGAVLQAYALQTYLARYGHTVSVIDYIPFTHVKKLPQSILAKHFWRIPYKISEYIKESRLSKFRQRYLNLSGRYNSEKELRSRPPEYDVYICGSDQVWNPHFTAKGERKTTLSYFLAFGSESIKRIAYAASFGCTEYPEMISNFILPDLHNFNAISVRENSGCRILCKLGIKNISIMPDPTLLLTSDDYNHLISDHKKIKQNYIFFYSLHSGQKVIGKIKSHLKKQLKFNIRSATGRRGTQGINRWLDNIKSAQAVVTNSFHCVAFAILFKRPFVAIAIEGKLSGMNNRFTTLLCNLGLEDHIIEYYDPDHIDTILNRQTNWMDVDSRVNILRRKAEIFFRKNL